MSEHFLEFLDIQIHTCVQCTYLKHCNSYYTSWAQREFVFVTQITVQKSIILWARLKAIRDPIQGTKQTLGLGIKAPALVTSLRSLMSELLKWSVTSSSESRLMPIVGLIQDSSGYEVGLLANQGKILPPILWGIHDNLVFTSGCDKLGEDDYYTSPNELWLRCDESVWVQSDPKSELTTDITKTLKNIAQGSESPRSHNNWHVTHPDQGISWWYEAWRSCIAKVSLWLLTRYY